VITFEPDFGAKAGVVFAEILVAIKVAGVGAGIQPDLG
jgi:hypothetical protein